MLAPKSGDFRSLVEAVQRRGVRVSVVSTTSTQPPMIADELRRQADQFVDIVELQPKISRDPAARAAREAREPRHMPQFLQRGTTPQGAGADEEEFARLCACMVAAASLAASLNSPRWLWRNAPISAAV